MYKKAAIAAGILLAASPLIAFGQQQQSPADLQALINQLLQQIAALQAQLHNVNPSGNCVDLSSQLTIGSTDAATGGEVTKLQTYLQNNGYFTYTGPKGYYGLITANAVGKYQVAKGIVPSVNSNAAGITGPQTRAALSCHGQPSSSFSASPTSGAAPLTVNFTMNLLRSSQYMLDFGDGSETDTTNYCSMSPDSAATHRCTVNHTYTSLGTYVATLQKQSSLECDAISPDGRSCTPTKTTVGSVQITVVGSSSGAPTIQGLTGPVSLNVGQQGTWTVNASVPNRPGQQLSYSVVWGDEQNTPVPVPLSSDTTMIHTTGTFTHTYQTAGTYTPTFTVSNSAGSSKTSSSVVIGGMTNTLSASPTSGSAPLTVTFSNAWSSISFGDGTGEGTTDLSYGWTHTYTHTYTSAGTYTATSNGRSVTITVTSGSSFSASPTSGLAPLTVIFSNWATGGMQSSLTYPKIDYGDGSTPENAGKCFDPADRCVTPGTNTHTYAKAGTYTATITQAPSCTGDAACILISKILGTVTITVHAAVY